MSVLDIKEKLLTASDLVGLGYHFQVAPNGLIEYYSKAIFGIEKVPKFISHVQVHFTEDGIKVFEMRPTQEDPYRLKGIRHMTNPTKADMICLEESIKNYLKNECPKS